MEPDVIATNLRNLQAHLKRVREMLDRADTTSFGNLGHLLDDITRQADAAIIFAEYIERDLKLREIA